MRERKASVGHHRESSVFQLSRFSFVIRSACLIAVGTPALSKWGAAIAANTSLTGCRAKYATRIVFRRQKDSHERSILRSFWRQRHMTGKWSTPGVPHNGWVCSGVEDLGRSGYRLRDVRAANQYPNAALRALYADVSVAAVQSSWSPAAPLVDLSAAWTISRLLAISLRRRCLAHMRGRIRTMVWAGVGSSGGVGLMIFMTAPLR